jgi:two-component system chemotaxis response regulator CheY
MGPLTLPDLTVLIADSSVYCRRVLRDMMAQSGIKRVFEAADGAEALSGVAEVRPDLLLVDADIPFLNGVEVARMLRADQSRPIWATPIVLMVSRPHRRLIEEALASGVDDVLCKPMAPSSVWSHVGRLVELGRVKPAGPLMQRPPSLMTPPVERVEPIAAA